MADEPELARELERAARAGEAGDLVALERHCARVLATDARQPQALRLLAMARSSRGDHGAAERMLRASLDADPADPRTLLALGRVLEAGRRTAEAVAAYADATRRAPGFAEAWFHLGLAQAEAGNSQAALEPLEQAFKLRPQDPSIGYALGQTYAALGDYPAAIEAFEAARRHAESEPRLLHALAVALGRAGRLDESIARFEHAVAIEPRDSGLHQDYANALYQTGRIDDAIGHYQRALEMDPEALAAHASLARTLWQHRGAAGYLDSYPRAIRAAPGSLPLRLDYARWLARAERFADARDVLTDALQAFGPKVEVLRALGRCLTSLGDVAAGVRRLEGAVEQAPEDADCRRDLARVLLATGHPDAALAHVEAALETVPHEQESIALLGLCWRLLGDRREPWLNDYEGLVRCFRIRCPSGYRDLGQFNEALSRALDPLHCAGAHPPDQTLRGGTQSHGDLFELPIDEVARLRESIDACVRRYVDALPRDSDHPLHARRRERFRFQASWSCRLAGQGYHTNHVHPEGWISSCYYVSLPDVVRQGHGRAGWLKFGESNLGLGARERIAKTVQPDEGLLVLFPSYLYHGTIPFSSAEPRTTVAFDVVPD